MAAVHVGSVDSESRMPVLWTHPLMRRGKVHLGRDGAACPWVVDPGSRWSVSQSRCRPTGRLRVTAGPGAVHRAAVPRILLGELAHCFDRGHSESVPGQATHWQTEDSLRPGPLRNRMIIFALTSIGQVRSGQKKNGHQIINWPSNWAQ